MNARRIPPLAMLALVSAIESVPAPCRAQADHAASRTIGDTTFMLPAWAESAFVLTEFGLREDIEYESIPNFPVAAFGRYNRAGPRRAADRAAQCRARTNVGAAAALRPQSAGLREALDDGYAFDGVLSCDFNGWSFALCVGPPHGTPHLGFLRRR